MSQTGGKKDGNTMENQLKGIIRAICISPERGTEKRPVPEARLRAGYGIEGDAHAGYWHRQVSLLCYEKVEAFNALGAQVADGDFGENLLVSGINFRTLPLGTLLLCGEVRLRITQIGKECHSHCSIHQRVGTCIMPVEGVFAEVLEGGILRPGDRMEAVLPMEDALRAAVIVLSDKGALGQRQDESGPEAERCLSEAGYQVMERRILPDEPELLKQELMRLCDQKQVNLIVTSGGTGFSLRDQTPEATLAVADRNAPGIAEAIRAESMKYTKHAMLSRGVSVLRKQTLIVNLPGSPRAVRESMEAFLPGVEHGLRLLQGTDGECGRSLGK